MQSIRVIAITATLGVWGASPPAAQQEDCVAHPLRAEEVKEPLKRWSGLSPFANWRIHSIQLEPCVRDGLVSVHLEIGPPANWSLYRLPYRVRLTTAVDGASAAPVTRSPDEWRALAAGVKRMVQRAERHPDVRRFIERFAAVRAEIDKTRQPGRYRLRLYGAPQSAGKPNRSPSITYDESAAEGISGYRVPRMDSLPARRELLRMLEVLSLQHPRCRPTWIEARQTTALGAQARSVGWTFQLQLAGEVCPAEYEARLGSDGGLARSVTDDAEPSAKGDGGAN